MNLKFLQVIIKFKSPQKYFKSHVSSHPLQLLGIIYSTAQLKLLDGVYWKCNSMLFLKKTPKTVKPHTNQNNKKTTSKIESTKVILVLFILALNEARKEKMNRLLQKNA